MFFTRNENAAIILFTLTQNLAFATLNNVEKITEPSDKLIAELVNVPLLNGLNWISDPSESYRTQEVLTFIRGVESREVWARKILYALLKIERKIGKGNIQDIGVHDQYIVNARCSHTNVPNNTCRTVLLGEKYLIDSCNDSLSSSRCHPISNHTSKIVQFLDDSSTVDLKVNLKDLTLTEISTLLLLLTITVFMIICTICDIVKRKSEHPSLSTTFDTLSKFSLYTNARAILSTKVTHQAMPAIHGIRCLCCFWVIIGHRYVVLTIIYGHKITVLEYLELKDSWVCMFLEMTPYAVDIFMVLSGFFVTCTFLKVMDSGLKSNLAITYLYRYFRLTPCIFILLLFGTILTHRTREGTLWRDAIVGSAQLCQQSWWVYLLYAQNIIKDTYICLPHTWYLAVDMQLFWISPVILYPLHRWPRFGLKLLTVCFLASIVTPAVVLASNGHFNALLRIDVPSSGMMLNFANFYISTYNRASPYLVGIFLGYYTAEQKRRLTPASVTINWLIAGVVMLLCIWSTDRVYNTNFAYDLRMETACAALSRALWSIAAAWIIYACTQGYGGPVTKFLSLPLFFLPSRLAYCIYLVHPGIQAIALTLSGAPNNLLDLAMLYCICVNLVLSIATAFIFNLLVEAPVVTLAKILTSRAHEPEKTPVLQKTE